MNRVLMILMAVGAALGGLDRMIGNKFGLGERFDEGFHLLGSLALSMAGIMCLMPALSGLLERVIAPAFAALGMDPGMFGGILAIDMGGYQLAQSLARDPSVGRFSGIIVGATFGCTAVFTIPVGFSLTPKEAHAALSRGLMLGLMALPAALVTGGLICGLGLLNTIWQCMPILLIAGGYEKNSDFTDFINGFDGKVKYLLLLGQTAHRFADTARKCGFPEDRMIFCDSMKDVISHAYSLAEVGDTVLLSPASASWGMYNNFEERGEDFKALVRALPE